MKARISNFGVQRLALEIIRQAVYDYSMLDYQEEVSEFFGSDWAEELSGLYGLGSKAVLGRLKDGSIQNPKDFYAGAGPLLDKYLLTKNSRPARLLSLDQCSS